MKRRTPEERHAQLAALHDTLTAQVEALTTSDGWAAMLQAAARFHHYSPSNILLILAQRPDATHVAGLRTWNALGRHVRRGEKGLAILAPRMSRIAVESESASAEPSMADAEPAPSPLALRGFLVVHVFDLAQTDGEPLPIIEPRHLDAEVAPELWQRLVAVATNAGYTIERGPCGDANGRTQFDTRTIRVRDDLSPGQASKTLAHELGHTFAEHETRFLGGVDKVICRGVAEVEAESIAYLVLAIQGVNSEDYTVPYITGWADGDLDLVRATMGRCLGAAQLILDRLDATLVASNDRTLLADAASIPDTTLVASNDRTLLADFDSRHNARRPSWPP